MIGLLGRPGSAVPVGLRAAQLLPPRLTLIQGGLAGGGGAAGGIPVIGAAVAVVSAFTFGYQLGTLLRQMWDHYNGGVPSTAGFVDPTDPATWPTSGPGGAIVYEIYVYGTTYFGPPYYAWQNGLCGQGTVSPGFVVQNEPTGSPNPLFSNVGRVLQNGVPVLYGTAYDWYNISVQLKRVKYANGTLPDPSAPSTPRQPVVMADLPETIKPLSLPPATAPVVPGLANVAAPVGGPAPGGGAAATGGGLSTGSRGGVAPARAAVPIQSPSSVPLAPPAPSPTPWPGQVPFPAPGPTPSRPTLPDGRPAPLPVPPVPVTPEWLEQIGDMIIGQPSQQPRPDLVAIARELGRQEQKQSGLLSGLGIPDGLLEDVKSLYDFLSSIDPGGSYSIRPACGTGPNGDPLPPIEVPIQPGIGLGHMITARLDAIAELIDHHKQLRQPICKGKPTGQPVTVTFVEADPP